MSCTSLPVQAEVLVEMWVSEEIENFIHSGRFQGGNKSAIIAATVVE